MFVINPSTQRGRVGNTHGDSNLKSTAQTIVFGVRLEWYTDKCWSGSIPPVTWLARQDCQFPSLEPIGLLPGNAQRCLVGHIRHISSPSTYYPFEYLSVCLLSVGGSVCHPGVMTWNVHDNFRSIPCIILHRRNTSALTSYNHTFNMYEIRLRNLTSSLRERENHGERSVHKQPLFRVSLVWC